MARRLSLPEQWQLVELLGQSMGSHRFLLCRPERSPGDYVLDFAADDPNGEWLSYIPHLRPPLSVVRHSDPVLRTPATLKRLFHEFTLDDLEAKMFESVDGRNTIAQIIEAAATGAEDLAEVRSRAFRLFARMHDWDHLMFQK